ncbi:hypothetical protein [Staphylococcus simulans]|uniref:hypothetical protein n=1 Tax=Staphylococcus simulans TaxID=1286 RepID=UPI003999B11E
MKKRYTVVQYILILLTGIMILNSLFNPNPTLKGYLNLALFICVLLLALIAWMVGRHIPPKQ